MSNVSSFHTTPASLSRYSPSTLFSIAPSRVLNTTDGVELPVLRNSAECRGSQCGIPRWWFQIPWFVDMPHSKLYHSSTGCPVQYSTSILHEQLVFLQIVSVHWFRLRISDFNLSIYRIIRSQITSTPQVVSAVRLWRHRFTVWNLQRTLQRVPMLSITVLFVFMQWIIESVPMLLPIFELLSPTKSAIGIRGCFPDLFCGFDRCKL